MRTIGFSAARIAILVAGFAALPALSTTAGAASSTTAGAAASTTAGDSGGAAQPDKADRNTPASAADPSELIDPDMYATAIEVQQTLHFHSIRVVPVDKSENSAALIGAVTRDQPGVEALRQAVRGNGELAGALSSRGLSAGDVVAVTTDRNDDAILFVKP